MSNWLDYVLDVLANNPDEINQIAESLKRPSPQLVNWISNADGCPLSKSTEFLSELLDFETVKNLGHLDPSVNKARQFRLSFKDRCTGIVDGHLAEMSESFPDAIFPLEYFDIQYGYSGKSVIRAGALVRSIFDGSQKAQSVDWTLIDIFAPFRTEYYAELPFGSLWTDWLEDMQSAIRKMKSEASGIPTSAIEATGATRTEGKTGDPQ